MKYCLIVYFFRFVNILRDDYFKCVLSQLRQRNVTKMTHFRNIRAILLTDFFSSRNWAQSALCQPVFQWSTNDIRSVDGFPNRCVRGLTSAGGRGAFMILSQCWHGR